MGLIYVILIMVGFFCAYIIADITIDNWEHIIRVIKNIFRCLGQIIIILITILVLGLIFHWLFKDCTPKDPEVIYHDYDPGLRRKY